MYCIASSKHTRLLFAQAGVNVCIGKVLKYLCASVWVSGSKVAMQTSESMIFVPASLAGNGESCNKQIIVVNIDKCCHMHEISGKLTVPTS